jgi:hypothetical protein
MDEQDAQRGSAATKDGQDVFNIDKQDIQDQTQCIGGPGPLASAGPILSILFIHVKNLRDIRRN